MSYLAFCYFKERCSLSLSLQTIFFRNPPQTLQIRLSCLSDMCL